MASRVNPIAGSVGASLRLAGLLRRGQPWAVFIALLATVACLWQARLVWQASIYQKSVAEQRPVHNSTWGADQTPQALFANAYDADAHGQSEQALSGYARVVSRVPPEHVLRKQAYFNSGNIYMRMATRLLEQQGLPAWDEAGPLVALAKESYQKALRIDPTWSEVKYNYQLALRLAPTTYGMHGPQQYEDEQIQLEEKPSGWPAMPGNPRGMP